MRLHTGFVLDRIASELRAAQSTKARRCSGGCATCTLLRPQSRLQEPDMLRRIEAVSTKAAA